MKTNRHHLYLGLALIVVSFVYWWLPKTHTLIGLANVAFSVGNIFFFDYLSERFGGYSLLKVKNRRRHFLILGILFGVFLEFFYNWTGKFWYFPYWNIYFYALVFVPGFAFYCFYLLESYLGIKALLEYLFTKKNHNISFKGASNIFIAAGLLGTAILTTATTIILLKLPASGWKEAFYIDQSRQGMPEIWYLFLLCFVGLWLVLELLEYRRHETSLLLEIYNGNIWPLVAIVVAGVFAAVFYEIFNLPGGLWRYTFENAPLPELRLLGFPLILYIAWPLHFLPAFSLYRLLYKKETEKLWQ